jgi:hypothetical protein
MNNKDILIATIKANIIQNDMNHSVKLKTIDLINEIAIKCVSLIKKQISLLDVSVAIVEFAEGHANIKISGVDIENQDHSQILLFERSLQSVLTSIANNYNNDMNSIITQTKNGLEVDDAPESTTLNKMLYKLKMLDPLSNVTLCGDKNIPMITFDPIAIEISKPPQNVNLKLNNETISGLIVSINAKQDDLYALKGMKSILVTIYTFENRHIFNALLSYAEIRQIVLMTSRISGEISSIDGKKMQMLRENFVIEF